MRTLLGRLRGPARFLYDFLVGDDWQVAVVVVAAMALTVLLAHHGVTAWWVVVAAFALVLPYTIWRVTRTHRR